MNPSAIHAAELAAEKAMYAGVALRMAEECARQYRERHHVSEASASASLAGTLPTSAPPIEAPFHGHDDD